MWNNILLSDLKAAKTFIFRRRNERNKNINVESDKSETLTSCQWSSSSFIWLYWLCISSWRTWLCGCKMASSSPRMSVILTLLQGGGGETQTEYTGEWKTCHFQNRTWLLGLVIHVFLIIPLLTVSTVGQCSHPLKQPCWTQWCSKTQQCPTHQPPNKTWRPHESQTAHLQWGHIQKEEPRTQNWSNTEVSVHQATRWFTCGLFSVMTTFCFTSYSNNCSNRNTWQ